MSGSMIDHAYPIHTQTAIDPEDKQAIKDMLESYDQVRQARARVRQKTSFISFLSLKPLIFDHEEMELSEMMGMPHETSVWLNIMQIFLSTVNAYITVPTTNAYAEQVGVDPAYSGVIIGMSPIAQIFSALVFSYWSNFAFKAPLLVSCILQLLGNVWSLLAHTQSMVRPLMYCFHHKQAMYCMDLLYDTKVCGC